MAAGRRPWDPAQRAPYPSSGAWLTGPDAGEATVSGPLEGLRVCVKDVIDVRGLPTTAGTSGWSRRPAGDAATVAALRAAGAQIAGKGHTVEFAMGIDGLNPHLAPCLNPWDPERVCGGSSSGPAAAVAAGEADIGLGTDTAGSLRVPAGCCGLFTLRPTHGLLAMDGVLALAPSLDVCGPLTRDAHTLALAMTALAGWQSPPAGAGVPARAGLFAAGGAEDMVAARLAERGTRIVAVDLPDFARARDVQRVIQNAEAARVHDAGFGGPAPRYSEAVRRRLADGRAIGAAQLAAARAEAAAYVAQIWELFERERLDVVLLATTPFVAPRRDAVTVAGLPLREAMLRHVASLSLLGAPILGVPAAVEDGLPLGVQIIGRPGADRELVALAAHL
ncbi:MAG: 1-carboxybiuret hydrolase [Solirubrobacteraceae bacterium]|jgi:aspartyl-tRNA(Asn)/glutamyl-tRNA(Gln) amidotransferase subunit A|nr:1-carboxybiuret hydrolase [Solirubrobacteraceae bacterium]